MSKWDKLLANMRSNPNGIAFKDLERLVRRLGWVRSKTATGHRIYRCEGRNTLVLSPRTDGKAHRYQVEQVLGEIDINNLEV